MHINHLKNKEITRLFIGSLVVILLSVSLFCLSAGGSVSSDGDHHSACPAMQHHEELGSSDVASHITYWQQLFTAPVATTILSIFMMLLISLAITTFVLNARGFRLATYRLPRQFIENPERELFYYLRRCFSQGLIHPKLY